MSKPVRVLVNAIPAANPVTGIGRYLIELYAAMGREAGVAWSFSFFDGRRVSAQMPAGPADMGRFSAASRLFWRLPASLALAVRLGVHRVREHRFRALSEGFDLYHEAAFFPFAAAPGTRIVQTVCDLTVQLHPEWHPAERVAYTNRYFDRRLRWADALLCISDFTRKELLDYAPDVRPRTHVTALAVDERFRPASPDVVQRVRERYGLPEKFLLHVGSGDPRKNTGVVAAALQRGRIDCPLVLAGWEGWSGSPPGVDVRTIGYVPDADLPALYSAARAFVYPSLHEGFGLPVLEAMACGCPAIVPQAHSMPEVAGEAGVYFDAPADAASLEVAMRRVVLDSAYHAERVTAGLAQARRFSWAETARRTLGVFEACLTRPARPRA